MGDLRPEFEAASELEEQRRRNREKYPKAAAFFDLVRSHYPGALVTYIGEMRPKTREVLVNEANLQSQPADASTSQRSS